MMIFSNRKSFSRKAFTIIRWLAAPERLKVAPNAIPMSNPQRSVLMSIAVHLRCIAIFYARRQS